MGERKDGANWIYKSRTVSGLNRYFSNLAREVRKKRGRGRRKEGKKKKGGEMGKEVRERKREGKREG